MLPSHYIRMDSWSSGRILIIRKPPFERRCPEDSGQRIFFRNQISRLASALLQRATLFIKRASHHMFYNLRDEFFIFFLCVLFIQDAITIWIMKTNTSKTIFSTMNTHGTRVEISYVLLWIIARVEFGRVISNKTRIIWIWNSPAELIYIIQITRVE